MFAVFKAVYPQEIVKKSFDEVIESTFPNFVSLYNQAFTAEQYNLNDICGAGYRKALESLVKEYLVDNGICDNDEVAKLNLAASINKIDNEQIRTLAKSAKWIGNSETHYDNKNSDTDLQKMKSFIGAMAHFIADLLIYKQALAMQEE